MTYDKVADMLDEIGLPFTYRFYPEGSVPDLPYIVFYYPSRDDFGADNVNYVRIENVNVELYTENKDFATEALVETVFKNHGIYYEKTETYLSTEQMYECLYEIQIITE